MKQICRFIKENLEEGKACTLITIISSEGSAPRGAGTSMAVSQSGQCFGTIGGGAVEHRVSKMAADVMKKGRSKTDFFMLHPNDVQDLGMICGGDIRVYLQYIAPSDENCALYETICKEAESNQNRWIVFEVDERQHSTVSVLSETEVVAGAKSAIQYLNCLSTAAAASWRETGSYYIQPLAVKGKVYIFGGGHIARKLVPLLSGIDFSCVVYDSLEEFSDPADFPLAKEVICGSFDCVNDRLRLDEADFAVIMTRGHAFDYTVLRQVLEKHTAYTGMIGSRSKVQTTRTRLLGDGFSEADIARIHSPIGLSIGAQTPAEISVSIAAEMIAVRAALRKGEKTEN
ncbi:XdhC/CoxI family protein [Anaerovoracaceae bacterium 41-7]|jgi:xanthine dehydrogenase accessory factor|uniref:XdhC family protein n=1 Tax=Anaerovoracaceae TaxID=543314 RepID=UPI00203A651E|nr:XdhC/CoxI family protein [Senimuribacter intestinalis]MCI9476577.1 XdhC family protein [Emergencia sp.]